MGQAAVIWVTSRFRAGPDQAEPLIALLRELAEHSRVEPGCIEYGYYQSGADFTSIEIWDSAEAERSHNDTDFLRAILQRILPLLDGRPQVTRWSRIA
jgi:quinol monooxygenase YgiN